MKTSWADKNGIHEKYYSEDDFDYLCIYSPETDKCYFISMDELKTKRSIALRLDPTKNNQSESVILAENYLEIK